MSEEEKKAINKHIIANVHFNCSSGRHIWFCTQSIDPEWEQHVPGNS